MKNGSTAKYIVDTFAWIEYFDGTVVGAKVKKLFDNKHNSFYTSSAVVAELVSKAKRKGDDPLEYFEAVASISAIVPVDYTLAYNAGLRHAEIKEREKDFGMIDAIVLATAEQLNGRILSGDPHFKEIKNVFFLG